jgi:hypothetical protein
MPELFDFIEYYYSVLADQSSQILSNQTTQIQLIDIIETVGK